MALIHWIYFIPCTFSCLMLCEAMIYLLGFSKSSLNININGMHKSYHCKINHLFQKSMQIMHVENRYIRFHFPTSLPSFNPIHPLQHLVRQIHQRVLRPPHGCVNASASVSHGADAILAEDGIHVEAVQGWQAVALAPADATMDPCRSWRPGIVGILPLG